MTTRMLVTVDDSRESLSAARAAADLARQLGAQVRVLAVIEDNEVGEEVERLTGPGSRERREAAVSHLLEYVRREICAHGVPEPDVETVRERGSPFRKILDVARSWPADLIVMAVSDQRGVRSNYVGSVTQRVIEFADCPVLVVPRDTSA